MAYNDYSMGGYIPGDTETEEERRRRLEREAAYGASQDAEDAAMGAAMSAPVAGGGVDLAGMASRYVSNRAGAAQQRVADAGQVFTDPQAAFDRRMGMAEQPDAANTEVQSQQVKTYADGSQEHVVKTQSPAPAPVAVAPTPMAPQPQMTPAPAAAAQITQPAPQAQAQTQTTPVPGQMPNVPVSPEEAARQEAIVRSVQQQAQNLPQPGEGVQLAGPMVPGAVAAPVVQQAPAAAPGASLAQAGQVAQTQPTRPQWAIDLEAAGTDQTKLIDIAANRAYPEDVRNDAKAKLRTAMASADAATEAEKTVTAAAQGDPRAQQKLLNSIKPASVKKEAEGPVTEGSYIRAYLYARLGLNDLAKEEQEKILGRSKFGQVIVDGAAYEVENDPRTGRILTARDAEGNKVDTPILNKIRAESNASKSVVTHTGKMQDVTTGEVYYEQTTPNGIRLVDNNGKVYKGSSASLRPFGIGSDISTKNQIQLNELQNKLAYAGPTASAAEREKVLAESEAKYGPLPETYKAAVRAGQPMPTGMAGGGAVMQPASAAAPAVTTTPATARPNVPVNPNAPAAAPARVAAPAPAITQGGGYGAGGANPAGRIAGTEIGVAAAKENIQVAGKRSESFNKILDEEVRPQAQAGDTVSSVRKQQFAIFDRPGVDTNKLFGLYNAAAEGTGDQKLSIIRDIFGGIFKPEAEVSQRLALLNLSPQEKSALMEYNTANQRVNAATLKQNSGPGAVSDAEQRANREANVDITKVPALGAFNAMAQSQFDGDRARWKADWAPTQKAQNALELDKAWRKENQRLSDLYRETATQRAKFIAENGGTTAAVQLGYKRFPVPEYDPATETWKRTRPITNYDR